MLFPALLSQRAALTPNREALVDLATGQRQTYAQLEARANRAAHLLGERFALRPGDRIAVLAHNSASYLELFLAAGKLGAILVPLNWRLSPAELTWILADCEPTVLACGPEHAPAIEELRAHLELPPILCLESAAAPGLDYEGALGAGRDTPPAPPRIDAEAPACILYTSGTTGRPKGAVIPHRQVLWNCIATAAGWGLSQDDVTPVFTPLFHAGGLFVFLTPLLYLGGRVVLDRRFEGEADLRTIEAEGCTVILGVPTIYRLWRETRSYHTVDLSRVRFFISGGAPCPPALMAAWREERGVAFRQGYGLTEAGPNCFAITDEDAAARPGSIGKPILHTEATLVGGGAVGELALRGPHLCAGYWRNPRATEGLFQDGWLLTGDLAERDDDGFYAIVGRAKDMIISGGENVYAAEVEAVFQEHPAVAEAALVGIPDDTWGEIGLLAVIPRGGELVDPGELLRWCSGRLARYKIPKRIVLTDDFPRTALGKPVKAELRRRYAP